MFSSGILFVSNNRQLDTDLLSGYIDNLGKDIVQQMLDLYIQQSVGYIENIAQSIEEESQTLWQDHCHKMKGAAGSVGLLLVHAQLVKIEKSTESWVSKGELHQNLMLLNENAIRDFSQWLTEQH